MRNYNKMSKKYRIIAQNDRKYAKQIEYLPIFY